MTNQRRMRRRALALGALTALPLAAVGGSAVAGHFGGDVASYTGCLNASSTITKVAAGDAPLAPCQGSAAEVHLSGGDITSITGGTGVVVANGANGDATVSIDPQYGLRQDCSNGAILEWDSTGWACATDDDTTYAAGAGLDLLGNEFRIDPAYAAGVEVWHTYRAEVAVPTGVTFGLVADLDLPAGTYKVEATGYGRANPNPQSDVLIMRCRLSEEAETAIRVLAGGHPEVPFALQDVVSLPSGGVVELGCRAFITSNNEVEHVHMTATRVAAVHEQ